MTIQAAALREQRGLIIIIQHLYSALKSEDAEVLLLLIPYAAVNYTVSAKKSP